MVDDFKKYFTVKDIAKKFGDTEEWIRDLIQAKKIKAAKIGPQKDSQIGEKTVEIAVEKTVEKILILLKANPQITQKGIMNNTGLTRRGVEWNLKKLKDEKKIRRIGPDKGGHWEVVKG